VDDIVKKWERTGLLSKLSNKRKTGAAIILESAAKQIIEGKIGSLHNGEVNAEIFLKIISDCSKDDALISGLEARGFVNTEEIHSKGKCHKNERHYILLTDGLVIYSSIPSWTSVKHFPDELEESWPLIQSERDKENGAKAFSFEALDMVMALMD
jgi:hypothetical protein